MKKDIQELLSKNGLRFTKARIAILQVLQVTKIPLTYEQIKNKLAIKMDKATFYRNMTIFEDHRIISKFQSQEKAWLFELGDGRHAHFICESCHEISCIHVDIPKELKGHHVSSMIIKGECKECSQDYIKYERLEYNAI